MAIRLADQSDEWLIAERERLGSGRAIADEHGWSKSRVNDRLRAVNGLVAGEHLPKTVRNACRVESPAPGTAVPVGKPEKSGARITDTSAILVSAPNPQPTASLSPADLFAAHGLDPDDWEYQATINRWDALAGDGKVTTLAQLKISAKRKRALDLILPPHLPGWIPKRPAARRAVGGKPRRVYVTSDMHAPYHDAAKHDAACQLLADIKPDDALDLGDMLDLPRPSRHRPTPGWNASPKECVVASYQVWGERVAANPGTRWRALLGNHDDRLRMAAEERIPDFHDLTPPGAELSPFDVGHLLRFGELGVELVRPAGEYHAAEVVIAEGIAGKPWTRLVGIHGTAAGTKGAPGAGKAADRRSCSILQGHDHRQGLTYLSRWDGERRVGDVLAASIGTSSTRDGGIGYAVDPDWQQGDAMVTIWPDGHWHVELIRWDGGELTWRDHRYIGVASADTAA